MLPPGRSSDLWGNGIQNRERMERERASGWRRKSEVCRARSVEGLIRFAGHAPFKTNHEGSDPSRTRREIETPCPPDRFCGKMLHSCCRPQHPATETFKPGTHKIPPQPYFFGVSDAKNLCSCQHRIVLLSAITPRDESILMRIRQHNPVKPESMLRSSQDDIAFVEFGDVCGDHFDHLSITNRRRHAAAARLEAHP